MEIYSKIYSNTEDEIVRAIKVLELENKLFRYNVTYNFQPNGTQVRIEGDKEFADEFFKRLRDLLKGI